MPVIEDRVGLALERIMVALDFEDSEPALEYGKALARRFSSRLVLAHVVDLAIAIQAESAAAGFAVEAMRRGSAEKMDRALTELSEAGFRATGQTLEAKNVAAAIVGVSEQIKADLIVMGTHARHGLNRVIFGSCAEGVIRHASCPVLTVGPQAKPPVNGRFSPANIVFATSLNHDAAEKAAVALMIAEDTCSKVHLCYSLENPNPDISRTMQTQIMNEEELRKLVPRGSYERCGSDYVVDCGDAASHILNLAGKVKADLIIMGARRSSNWLATLSQGVVGHVLAKAECPVMTVCTN